MTHGNTGRKRPPGMMEKLRLSNIGRPRSEETKEKQRAYARRVTVDGVVFLNIKAAAAHHGITVIAAYQRIKNANYPRWQWDIINKEEP